ncbi:hypothetical protein DPMN_031449 [Dreissena polymorpha]|uniref:Uncharacterized protein n=1 Tax=Dreissena polymorpha TaxID=45954 RepID=A0A9D4RH45_DREPO|nr:hypothetical protein DPMN_031449 [Dreissena polymorpha]
MKQIQMCLRRQPSPALPHPRQHHLQPWNLGRIVNYRILKGNLSPTIGRRWKRRELQTFNDRRTWRKGTQQRPAAYRAIYAQGAAETTNLKWICTATVNVAHAINLHKKLTLNNHHRHPQGSL